MSDEQVTIIMAGESQTVNLSDLLGIDLGEVETYRGGEAMPAGVFEWRLKGAEMDIGEVTDRETKEKVKCPRVLFTQEVIAVRQLMDASIDKATLIGAEHTERFFIRDVLKDIGRVKAFMEDIGRTDTGPLSELLDRAIGTEYVAAIKHTKNKNDTSIVYGNLDMKTIKPLGGDAAPAATGAAPKPAGLFGKK